MSTLNNSCDHFVGDLVFDDTVSEVKLVELCKQLKDMVRDRWIHLHVRNTGDYGYHKVTFHFILPDGKKKTRKKFEHTFLGVFREALGVRPHQKGRVPIGCKSWSMTTHVVVV